MKIEKGNSFRIIGSNATVENLSKLKKGALVSAKITEKLNPKEAILDISGSRVRVEFLKGVPGKTRLQLILDKSVENTFYFKIFDKTAKAALDTALNKLLGFTIFNSDEANHGNLPRLSSLFKGEWPGIFTFNIEFFKILRGNLSSNNRITRLLEQLSNMGIQADKILLLSLLFNSSSGFNLEKLISILMIFGFAGNKNNLEFRKYLEEPKTIQEKLEAIMEDIKTLIKGNNKNETILRQILDNILIQSEHEITDHASGEILFFEDKERKIINYIFNKNSIVFSFDLSYLGRLEILIKFYKSYCDITFFCNKERTIEDLKKEVDNLKDKLNSIFHKNINVFFYNNKEANEKIVDIYSSLGLTKSLDIRV